MTEESTQEGAPSLPPADLGHAGGAPDAGASSPPISTAGEHAGAEERSGPSSDQVAREFAASGEEHAGGEDGEGGRGDARRRKRRRSKRGGGEGVATAPAAANQGRAPREREPRQTAEDHLDRDAEHLAREARSVPHPRVRPLAVVSREVRRLIAPHDGRDLREARRALVMLKAKLAWLAGREVGRERTAFVRVRDAVFKSVDSLVKNREQVDPRQTRNFLDHLDAFVGYHRFHSDDRRRDG